MRTGKRKRSFPRGANGNRDRFPNLLRSLRKAHSATSFSANWNRLKSILPNWKAAPLPSLGMKKSFSAPKRQNPWFLPHGKPFCGKRILWKAKSAHHRPFRKTGKAFLCFGGRACKGIPPRRVGTENFRPFRSHAAVRKGPHPPGGSR